MDGSKQEQLLKYLEPFSRQELVDIITDICKHSDKDSIVDRFLSRVKTDRKWCKLFVHQLSYSTTQSNLEQYYAQFGKVKEAVVLVDKNGSSKGYGFVTFSNADEAINAARTEKRKIDGRMTHCTLAWKGNPKKMHGVNANNREAVNDRRLFVYSLAWKTTDETLREAFERHGEIQEAVVIRDKKTGKSKGYGFVTFKAKEAAEDAVRNKVKVIDDRKTHCNFACERPDGSFSSSSMNSSSAQSNMSQVEGESSNAYYIGSHRSPRTFPNMRGPRLKDHSNGMNGPSHSQRVSRSTNQMNFTPAYTQPQVLQRRSIKLDKTAVAESQNPHGLAGGIPNDAMNVSLSPSQFVPVGLAPMRSAPSLGHPNGHLAGIPTPQGAPALQPQLPMFSGHLGGLDMFSHAAGPMFSAQTSRESSGGSGTGRLRVPVTPPMFPPFPIAKPPSLASSVPSILTGSTLPKQPVIISRGMYSNSSNPVLIPGLNTQPQANVAAQSLQQQHNILQNPMAGTKNVSPIDSRRGATYVGNLKQKIIADVRDPLKMDPHDSNNSRASACSREPVSPKSQDLGDDDDDQN